MKHCANVSAVGNSSQIYNVFLKTALILFPSLGHTPVQAFTGKWLAQHPAQRAATFTKQQTEEKEKKNSLKTSDFPLSQKTPGGHGLFGKNGKNLETVQTFVRVKQTFCRQATG